MRSFILTVKMNNLTNLTNNKKAVDETAATTVTRCLSFLILQGTCSCFFPCFSFCQHGWPLHPVSVGTTRLTITTITLTEVVVMASIPPEVSVKLLPRVIPHCILQLFIQVMTTTTDETSGILTFKQQFLNHTLTGFETKSCYLTLIPMGIPLGVSWNQGRLFVRWSNHILCKYIFLLLLLLLLPKPLIM